MSGLNIWKKKSGGRDLAVSAAVFGWIFLVNVVVPALTELPTWPMYFVTIFYFAMGAKKEMIPQIFIGGAAGLSFTVFFKWGMDRLGGFIGGYPALILLLFVILGCVILGGNFFPVVFNNITFAYFTVGCLELTDSMKRFPGWMGMLLLGGGIILAGAVGVIFICNSALAVVAGKKEENNK